MFSRLFGIFTYNEDLTKFKKKALVPPSMARGLTALALIGIGAGGTIAAAQHNIHMNAEAIEPEKIEKTEEEKQKEAREVITRICEQGTTSGSLKTDKQNICTSYINGQAIRDRQHTSPAPAVMVI